MEAKPNGKADYVRAVEHTAPESINNFEFFPIRLQRDESLHKSIEVIGSNKLHVNKDREMNDLSEMVIAIDYAEDQTDFDLRETIEVLEEKKELL